MKITEIIKEDLPVKVKLNNNFTLDDSFDVGTILQINNYLYTEDDCYEIYVTALNEDFEHNKSIAIPNWISGKNRDIDYYEFNKSNKDSNGNYKDSIFVMGDDDCFDLINNNIIIEIEKTENDDGDKSYSALMKYNKTSIVGVGDTIQDTLRDLADACELLNS